MNGASLEVTVNTELTIIKNTVHSCQWTIQTALVPGNVYATLKKHYPDAEASVKFWVNNFVDRINGKDGSSFPLFGCREYGQTLAGMNDYINGRESFSPTYQEIENLRESYRMTSAPLHSNLNRKDEITFSDLKAPMEVIIAVLYFYVMNGWTLKKCELCGKWFATTHPQTKFCSRKFEYTDSLGEVRSYQDCNTARDDIAQRLEKYRRKIVQFMKRHPAAEEFCNLSVGDFTKKTGFFMDEIHSKASIDNFKNYEHYLYVDCENLYKRYGRESRK